MRAQYPDETPEQLARRLVDTKAKLSYLAGTLTHMPMLVPGMGIFLKYLGVVGGASIMMRMHLGLILEIAALYGKDLDDMARVSEMAAVMAAVGLGTATPFAVRVLGFNPLLALPAAALSASVVTHVVGGCAIWLYGKSDEETWREDLIPPAIEPS